MKTHTERLHAVKRHNWKRLYKALDKLEIGETMQIDFGKDGHLFQNKAHAAIRRHFEKHKQKHWYYAINYNADGGTVHKLEVGHMPPPSTRTIG